MEPQPATSTVDGTLTIHPAIDQHYPFLSCAQGIIARAVPAPAGSGTGDDSAVIRAGLAFDG